MRAKREPWLDALKGFAIVLVVLGHSLSGYLDANTFPEAYAGFYALRSWIYSFHMPLFFLISGFTFTLAYCPPQGLCRQRYARQMLGLLWVYVLFTLFLWGIKQLVPGLVNETYTIDDLLRMFIEPLGNFWYLYVLLVFYLLAAMVRLPQQSFWWYLFLGGSAILVADIHLDWTHLTWYRIIYHFFFFALGCGICRNRKLLEGRKLTGSCTMFLCVAAYFYFFCYVRNWYSNWKLMIALCTCWVYLWSFYHHRCGRSKLLQLCGRYCMEIYLMHTFFTAGLRSVLPLLGITSPWRSLSLNFLISFGVSLGLAVLSKQWSWTDLIFRPNRFWDRYRG